MPSNKSKNYAAVSALVSWEHLLRALEAHVSKMTADDVCEYDIKVLENAAASLRHEQLKNVKPAKSVELPVPSQDKRPDKLALVIKHPKVRLPAGWYRLTAPGTLLQEGDRFYNYLNKQWQEWPAPGVRILSHDNANTKNGKTAIPWNFPYYIRKKEKKHANRQRAKQA